MKRRSIFAAMAAAVTAVAQQFKGDGPEPDWRQCADPREYPSECGKKLARPNQCPVCGTMAEPFHPEMCLVTSYKEVPCQTERIIRCHRCNAAFWQDAEEKRR